MALDGQITVTTEQLRAQATEVKNLLDTMTNQFTYLKDTVNGTSSYWIGEAGDTHRKQYIIRISKIEEMFARYTEHVTDLEKMAGIYEEAETVSAEVADELPISTLD